MKSGALKHASGQFFSKKEIEFAQSKNPNPHYVIRIAKNYLPKEVEALGKKVVPFFKNELLKMKKLVEAVVR